jgi:tetratricopeptide (TPR) repeat protein
MVELQPLTRTDTGALVAERLALGVLEEALADKVFGVTHGNPRMIDELLQSFIDSGIIFRSRQRWIVSGKLQEAELPPGIEGLVSARIDELDTDARRFVQAAAVVGTRFDPDMVRRVAGLQIDLEWVLSQLIDRRIVVADPEKPSLLRFAHETYRAVAEASVPAKEKRFLHSRAGQYLEETTDQRDPRKLQTVAFHLAEGADHEKATKVLLRAARRLAEVHQIDDAVARLEKLVTLAAPLGYANYDLSRSEAELDEALYRLAMLYLRKGMIDEADERLQWAYGRSRHFFSGEVRVWSLFGLAELNLARGRADEARKFLEMAAVDAEGMRDAGLLAITLLSQARLFNAEGNAEQALDAAQRGLEEEAKITPEQRKELPQPVTRPLLLVERATALHRQGKSNDAQLAFEEAVTLAEAAGDAAARGQAALALAKLAASHRNYVLAQQHTGAALESFRSIGDRIGEGRAIHNFAIVALSRGDAPKAQAALSQAEVIFAEIDHREGLALIAEARAMSQAPAGAG